MTFVKETNEYLKTLFDVNNPLIYSFAIILFFLVFIYIFYKYIYFPAQKKHITEKKEIEMKAVKLMALFAQLDPDPAIRIDATGRILQINDAAKIIDLDHNIVGKNIKIYFPDLTENLMEIIKSDSSFTIPFQSNSKFYEVCFKSISNLQIAQLYFRDLTERKLFEKELIESKKSLQNLSNHIQDTVEDERKRIARELHDSVGQNLLFIKLLLRECKSIGQLEKILPSLLSTLDSTIIELKRISYQMKPAILDETDLYTALLSLSKIIMAESGIHGEVDFIGNKERFNNKIEIAIYRVVQEALTNIIKHSQANHFSIQIINNVDLIKVLISDNGVGIKTKSDTQYHFGFLHMKDRVENLNGVLKIDSSRGNGTVIMISIPKNGYDDGK